MWNNPSDTSDANDRSRATSTSNRRLASLGPSITIKGDLSGGEDLLIEGRVEGQVSVPKHGVTIGKSGRVMADVYSKTIVVEGEVKGNLFGDENVVVRQSGRVEGNIKAPRVSLEGGSTFRGSIDMEPGSAAAKDSSARSGSQKGSEKSAEKTGTAKGSHEQSPATAKSALAGSRS